MKRALQLVWLLLLCLPVFPAQSRHYHFRHFMIEDGLPINTVYSSTSDHLGYMWFGTRDGLCRYDGTSFEKVTDDSGIAGGMVSTLCEDHEGCLWFSNRSRVGRYHLHSSRFEIIDEIVPKIVKDIKVDRDGSVWILGYGILFHYLPAEQRVECFEAKDSYNFMGACADIHGQVWFTTLEGRIVHYDAVTRKFVGIAFAADAQNSRGGTYPEHITVIDDTYLLVSTNRREIYRVNMHTGKAVRLLTLDYEINCLLADSPKEYWIGTFGGVYIYDVLTGCTSFCDDGVESGLSNNNVTCMSRDKEGNVWLGTYYGGLNFSNNPNNSINRIFYTGTGNDFAGKVAHAFVTDENGVLWVGTEDGHLNRLDFNRKSIAEIPLPGRLNIHSLMVNEGCMWVMTFENGVFLFNRKTGEWTRRKDSPSGKGICMIRLEDGSILMGASTGLYRYDPMTDSISRLHLPPHYIHSLYQDSHGTIWVGTFGDGLFFSNDNLQTLLSVSDCRGVETPPSDYINHIVEDSYHQLWVCTQGGGICCTSLDTPFQFHYITSEQGLPSNIACALVEDAEHGIHWVSTTNGLASIDSKTRTVNRLFLDNGRRTGNQYTNGSCCKLQNGRICFGTTNGFISFVPSQIEDPISNSPLYFRSIYAEGDHGNRLVTEDGKSVTATRKVTLRKKDAAHLSITFPAVYFSNMSTPKYEYSLSKGRNVLTRNVTANPMVALTDLRPGRYLLDVSLLNSIHPQARHQLSIRIVPPWFSSLPACLLYLLFFALLVVQYLVSLSRRRKTQAEHEREQLEALKQKEIYDAKINFFTNITQEIRTPLSLIKLPVDKIFANHDFTEAAAEDIQTIKANTDRLMELTNQLLDIRKMERNEVMVQYLHRDICHVVRQACGYFVRAAEEQHLQMSLDIPSEPFMMKCAPDIIQKIISSLLSNAIKFCHEKIRVELRTPEHGGQVEFRVWSDGDLIRGEDREKIFAPFYQIGSSTLRIRGGSGTGLGLPYSRTLAALHNATLTLDVSVTDGNCFVLSLPVSVQDNETAVEKPTEDVIPEETDAAKRTVLVVEDDDEMRKYLCRELSAHYNVFSAGNGEKAVKLLNEQRIDLIVSDVMMPVIDGCELCNYVKSNEAYSHIPVLLLTAVVGVETRIATLKSGADGYIEKPFEMSLLLANIANLFKNREISYRQFANSPLSHYNSVTPNKVENAFMEKLHAAIMEHLSDQDLGIDLLCDLLGTSKATLYRKIKANSGLNTNEYIRLCRLKKAADMLAGGEYRINEVAYLTGFSSPSYFATSFQKQFNISPSAFVKNLKE